MNKIPRLTFDPLVSSPECEDEPAGRLRFRLMFTRVLPRPGIKPPARRPAPLPFLPADNAETKICQSTRADRRVSVFLG